MVQTPVVRTSVGTEQALYREGLRRSGSLRRDLRAAAIHESLHEMVGALFAWRRTRRAAKDGPAAAP